MVQQDAWAIYGNEGLLAINDPGHQDFTVTDSQYAELVKDENGMVTQFTITSDNAPLGGGGTFVVNELGILIGPNGLTIINQVGVARIVFQSNGADFINILGPVQVEGRTPELVFVTSYKLNCNGCSFPGMAKVTFCTIPTSSSLANNVLAADPSSYCKTNEELYLNINQDVKAVVEDPSRGLRSGLEHWVKWGHAEAFRQGTAKFLNEQEYFDANPDVRNAILDPNHPYKGNAPHHFTTTFINEVRIPSVENSLHIGSKGLLSSSIDLLIIAGSIRDIGEVKVHRLDAKGNSLFEFWSKIHSDTDINIKHCVYLLSHGTGDFESIGNMYLEASRMIGLRGKVTSNHELSIKAYGFSSYAQVKADRIALNTYDTYISTGNIEAKSHITAIADNAIGFEPGVVFKSYGTMIIQNAQGGPMNLLNIVSATLAATGDATIKTKWLNNHRSGTHSKGVDVYLDNSEQKGKEIRCRHEDLSLTKDVLKWTSNNGYADAWVRKCWHETFVDNTGPESRFLIGGNFQFQGDILENDLSKFHVGGAISYIGAIPKITDVKYDLYAMGEFVGWYHHKKPNFAPYAVDVAKQLLKMHCGLDTNDQMSGTASRLIRTIGDPIAQHYEGVHAEIGKASEFKAVGYSYHNYYKKPFVDQRPAQEEVVVEAPVNNIKQEVIILKEAEVIEQEVKREIVVNNQEEEEEYEEYEITASGNKYNQVTKQKIVIR